MMQRIVKCAVAAAIVVLAAAPSAAESVDEALAKHIEAMGGREAWSKIESMKLSGTFASFSKVSPFTLHRKRDNAYHMDHVQDDKTVIIGVKGDDAWWENHWFQEGAQAVTGVDLAVVARDARFEPALFYVGEENGITAEYLGQVDLEGIPTIGVKMTDEAGAEETWYLDPDSYLAVGRDATGSDFGRPMPERTFFEDYRDVSGVKIPFYTETQWYTRDRVMRVENVEVNLEIDDALFALPAPPGMGVLSTMKGSFKVATAQRNSPNAPWQEGEREAGFENLLGGTMIREAFTTASGAEVLRVLTYDRFNKKYRVAQIDDSRGLLDILEGNFDEAGERLTLSNAETGTTWSGFGFTFHTKLEIFDITEDGFKMEASSSTDGGENWAVLAKAEYTRPEGD